MNKGDIVLVPFPFTDLSQTKLRPAIVLWDSSRQADVTLCFVSSQNVEQIYSDEFVLGIDDSEFKGTGLKVTSKVKITRIATIQRQMITRRLGKVGRTQRQQLNLIMIESFKLSEF